MAIRNSWHLTIKDVATKAGVSSSLLSQIERNRISRPCTPLELLEVGGVSPRSFAKIGETMNRVEIIKKDQRRVYQRRGFKYETLCGLSQSKGTTHFPPFFLSLNRGSSGIKHDGHLGRELGIVVNGVGQLIYCQDHYDISDGDALSCFLRYPM